MTEPPQSNRIVRFGDNNAIAALTFNRAINGQYELGASFHVPTRQEGGTTYYKALACTINITEAQRLLLCEMFHG